MRILFFFLILICSVSCKNETASNLFASEKNEPISDTVKKIIEPIKYYTVLEAFDTIYHPIHKKLYDVATEKELRYLIYNQKNVYIKSAAIDALVKKDNNAVFEVFKMSLNSDDQFVMDTECVKKTLSLAYTIAANYGKPDPDEGLTEQQAEQNMKKFLEMVFQQKPLNEKRIEEFSIWIPTDNEVYYKKIKEAITEKRSKHLLKPLALFERKEDIKLIKSFGKEAFVAIWQFPDDQFLDMFVKYISENEDSFYKMALRSYPEKKTVSIRKAIEKYNKTKPVY